MDRMPRGLSLSVLASSALVAACGSNVSVTAPSGAAPPVGNADRICVATAADGGQGTRADAGSGAKVTARTAGALRRRYSNVVVIGAGDPTGLETECRSRDGRVLVVPEILEWEDRASGWSGKPDRVSVKLTLYDLAGRTPARSVTFAAQTGYWSSAVAEWGNRPPEALLGADFDRTALRLLSS